MKTLYVFFSLIACLLLSQISWANNTLTPTQGQDSIIINFGNGSKIVVYVANEADKEKLKNLDINALIKKVAKQLEQLDDSGEPKVVNEDGVSMKIYYNEDKQQKVVMDSTKKRKSWNISWSDEDEKPKNKTRWVRSYVDLDLGLNNYLGTLPSRLYDLSPIGSRYVAIGMGIRIRLSKEKSPYIKTGLEIAWNNLMFENNNVRVGEAKFTNSFTLAESPINQEKSKLVGCYLNVPLTIGTRIKGTPFSVSAGGYVGYRLDSYAAFVESGKDKQRIADSYFMNNIRYGLRAALDLKYATLFCNYDLSPLFNTNNAPNLQVISFGVRFGNHP
ncbi:MAG: hypothetical protein ACOVQA_13685 [Thermoflexibacteraceae bacterium]